MPRPSRCIVLDVTNALPVTNVLRIFERHLHLLGWRLAAPRHDEAAKRYDGPTGPLGMLGRSKALYMRARIIAAHCRHDSAALVAFLGLNVDVCIARLEMLVV